MDLITIIIPVYQVENYLHQCISSLLIQTYSNLEIILVDDGSKDDSGSICDFYAVQDKRITVIHKTNGGLSDARNAALNVAHGKYVTFIDSDDYVSGNYIELLYNMHIKYDADISVCKYEKLWISFNNNKLNSKRKKYKIIEYVFTVERALEEMLYQKLFNNESWGKLYPLEYFSDIRYPVGKLFEDLAVTYKLVEKASKVAVSSEAAYFYLQRNDSIMSKANKFKANNFDIIYHADVMYQDIVSRFPKLTKAAINRKFSVNVKICKQLLSTNGYENEKKVVWKNIKETRKTVLFDRKSRIKFRVIALLMYFGNIGITIFSLIHNYITKYLK